MAIRNVHITDQLVQSVRDAASVLEIAGEHTRLTKAGRRHKGLCPLHKEKTPSFSVDPDRGFFYCFGCGQGGDAIKLHMMLSGDDFPAAIESLAQRYGIPLPKARPRRGGREELDLEPALAAAAEFFADRLQKSPATLKYLSDRRISSELIERFGLGFAPPGWRELVGALHPRIPMPELEAAGLVARSDKRPDDPYDRFRERLMFPIRNTAGRLVGFGGRTLVDDRAKYINSNETPRFHKGRLLYGLDLAKRSIRDGAKAFLVEGYFDALAAVEAGIEWVVASMGTALTPEQAKLLARFADDVVIGYDGDKAGIAAYRRALPLLFAEGLGVRRPDFGEGHDPDSLRLERGEEELRRVVGESPDAVTLELDRLAPSSVRSDPRRQARAAKEVSELLKPIADPILRYGYGRVAAERLGVPADLLWKRLGVGERPAAESSPEPARRGPEVRSLEERVLQTLLTGEGAPPAAAELPREEYFLDPACRNIFRRFNALYDGGERPEAGELLAALGSQGDSVDRLAGLLLEDSVGQDAEALRDSVGRLRRRWRQRRLRELSTEIGEAQRAGDRGRVESLLKEKTALSLKLHGLESSGADETAG
jgi:DNA primase